MSNMQSGYPYGRQFLRLSRAFSAWVGITGDLEVVGAFVRGEAVEQLADPIPQGVAGSFWGLAGSVLSLAKAVAIGFISGE
jgi:hypothetical protein